MEVQVFEEIVDLSNDMTWRQMIAVGVRRVVLVRGELDKLELPKYAARSMVLALVQDWASSAAVPLRERFLAIPNNSNTHT